MASVECSQPASGQIAFTFTAGAPQELTPGMQGPAMTAGPGGNELLFRGTSPRQVIFQYGGTPRDGDGSGTIWAGQPDSPERQWLLAEEIWGKEAAQGPRMFDGAILAYDERGQRLVLVGSNWVLAGQWWETRNEMWTFDLREGRWQRVSALPEGFYASFMTPAPDGLRERVLLVGAEPIKKAKVLVLDLRSLALKDLDIAPSGEEPGELWGAGAFLDPVGQALYLYGGLSQKDFSTIAYRLDLIGRRWSILGDGKDGPGQRLHPFVSYDSATGTLWVSGGEYGREEDGVPFWGLRKGKWVRRDSLLPAVEEGGTYSYTYDPKARIQIPVTSQEPLPGEPEPYPGTLYVASMTATDPNLGLVVVDSSGEVVAADLSPSLYNTVSFFAHSMYLVQVVPLPGLDAEARPVLHLSIAPAVLQEVGGFSGSTGVNDLMVRGDHAYLVGQSGLEAIDLSDLGSPERVGQLAIGGTGQAIAPCGDLACVSKSPQGGTDLVTLDLTSPQAPLPVGSLRTPGVSRSLGVGAGGWVYLSDGGAGVSIIDARNPAAPLRVSHLGLPGQVTSLAVSAGRLYVATKPDLLVRIYEITEEQSPVLLGELRSTAVVEAMRVQGNELHLAQHSGNEWQGCTSGHYCPRGTHVALFDVSDPASPVPLGEQDGAQSPFVHMVPYKDHALVRTFNGFAIYQAVAVP